eukprot:CAMPEP_0113945636 /NCGR_PEP_ID=MMETSP1339-20121228/48841_1 /TAXON_ID=94617 /ORGANISM="Fibrocapsa japonica" /LENGTH=118 /DNA_ID=CAMNT_0000951311 /DNA_START=26 /DNA_END=382 /DNA_ORIENTATION=- /assembly_acc=CAM_ASM_000762
MLKSNIKGVENGFPLTIEASQIYEEEAEFNADFMQQLIPKLEWAAVRAAVGQLGLEIELPPEDQDIGEMKESEEFLRTLHHILFEVHVIEGDLVCPETGRKFPIVNGIPNMLLHEDEV